MEASVCEILLGSGMVVVPAVLIVGMLGFIFGLVLRPNRSCDVVRCPSCKHTFFVRKALHDWMDEEGVLNYERELMRRAAR